jgi:hypothetical protein
VACIKNGLIKLVDGGGKNWINTEPNHPNCYRKTFKSVKSGTLHKKVRKKDQTAMKSRGKKSQKHKT